VHHAVSVLEPAPAVSREIRALQGRSIRANVGVELKGVSWR
jgi:hypothetical protein